MINLVYLSFIELLGLIIAFLVSFGITFTIMPYLIKYLMRRGIAGIDIHKPHKPEIPEMGGLAILIGLLCSLIVTSFIFFEYRPAILAFMFVILIAGGIGIYDDLKRLNPITKPFLLLFAVIPLITFEVIVPRPLLPIIGQTRLTILYWIILPLAIAVPANAVNMLDVLNGSMAASCMIVSFTLLICAILMDSLIAIILSILLLGVLFPFFQFNKYPAKIFSGDVGSLTTGAAIGAIAIIGRLEIAVIVALMPHIMNAFYFISSSGGLKEGKTLKRPIQVFPDGKLAISPEKDAPLTLTRLILSRGPLTEVEIVKAFILLGIVCAILAVISVILIPVVTYG